MFHRLLRGLSSLKGLVIIGIALILSLLFVSAAQIRFSTDIAKAPLDGKDEQRLTYAPTRVALEGERYSASMPDTLDLAQRMEIAINALTNAFIPQDRWALAFVVNYSSRPPYVIPSHVTDAWLNIPPKFIEALVNCRLASGSDVNLEVDRKILATQLGLIGRDGLTYSPQDAMPALKDGGYPQRNYSEIWAEGRSLLALSMLAQIDEDPRWIEIGRKKIDRLLELTRLKDGYRYFWRGRFVPGDEAPRDAIDPTERPAGSQLRDGEVRSLADSDPIFSMIYSVGALGHGSGLFYRVSRYPPALELSRGLAHWALAKMFKNADGRYDFRHFHHGLYALMAVAEYAEAAQDRQAFERVDACYRWARTLGDPLIGWYSEAMPGSEWYETRDFDTVETCEVADMVFLALYLTRAGLGDYWDDVDRSVRNHYAQAQVLRADFLKEIPDRYFRTEMQGESTDPPVSRITDHVSERSVGSFLGWMRANDGLVIVRENGQEKLATHGIMHCCTANGARTLYYVWDSIVTGDDDTARVNLLLNRASDIADVQSYLPAQGKVVIQNKKARNLVVRMSEWIDLARVESRLFRGGKEAGAGEEVRPLIEGRWLSFVRLQPQDRVILTFPVPEKSLYRVIGRRPFKLTLRGSNVIAIDPRGIAYPLYTDTPKGALIEKTLFVPKKKVIW